MCIMCDGGTYDDWLDATTASIDARGWTSVGVDGALPWAYTVGLRAGRPASPTPTSWCAPPEPATV